MALIVAPYAPGAIANYTDLIAAVRWMQDDDAYPQASIDKAIRLAEVYFNRELRTPEMEKSAFITVDSELSYLPGDFLSLREIYRNGDVTRPLKSVSPTTLVETYGGQSGDPIAYAIEGHSLRVAPVGDTTITIEYYAKIPPLTDKNTANWLIANYPDLYLWGTVLYCCQADRDSAGMQQASNAIGLILQSIKDASKRNRWGAGPLRPQGVRQVRATRA